MMAFDVDLFVIGGGSGGVRAARVAAQGGARVALAEASRMGGTCVLRGCVPKKLMVFASAYRDLPAEARAYGWAIGDGRFDWSVFRARLHAELDRLEMIYRRLLDTAGVTAHDQHARLVDPHEVELADGTRISARHILIATGGHAERPDLAGAELGMVSDDIFLMESLPSSILIVGGGFIACEMAGILSGLGVAVTQVYRGAQILRGFDDEARGLVAEAMRAGGIDLQVGTNILTLAPSAEDHTASRAQSGGGSMVGPLGHAGDAGSPTGPLWAKLTTGREVEADAVLFATGRRPNTAGLGLEAIGITPDRHGAIPVDAYSQTVIPSVFAIGDVTNRVNLTPVAIRDAMAFVRTVFDGVPTPVEHDMVPMAVFTQPELGTVGLTEEAAREQEPIEVYCTSFRPMRTAFADKPDRVLMKLVVSQTTRRVLGCHIVAPEAGEMIQLAAIAVRMGATKEDFDRTVAVHPTMAEEMVTMRLPMRRS